MNILIVSQYFWPENFRINDLTHELTQRGHNVQVLTGIPNYPIGNVFDTYKSDPESFERYANARIWRVPMLVRGHSAARLFLNYLSFAVGACIFGPWKLRGLHADVIFVFEPSPITVGLPAILLGKVKRAPVVFWALDLWPDTLEAMGVIKSPRLLKWAGIMVQFIYKHCALILGQSRGFLSSIAKYCSDIQKIRYFPNWAEEIYSQHDIQPASEVPVLANGFNVVFAGNIGVAQDFPAILDAAELLKHNSKIRWLIVGDGRKFDWLQQQVERRNLQEVVLLLGRFPVERMPSFYAHAAALLVTLKNDPVFSMTIPGKLQSYLLAGVPIVGMLDGEGAQVIKDANAGFVCAAGDSAGLAASVLQLSTMHADQRQQLGANGHVFAKKEFDKNQLMNRLEVRILSIYSGLSYT